MRKAALNTFMALLAGSIGGAAFAFFNLPLPWTLGSLAATAIAALAGLGWRMPNQVRDLARPVVGIMAGSAFTPAVVASFPQWWPAILTVCLYTLFVLLLGWLFFTRTCKFDATTAFFASSPGGLSELTLLGSALGGDIRTLVLIHSVRVVIVVFTVPFILQLMVGPLPSGPRPMPHAAETIALVDWAIVIACGVVGYAIGKLLHVPGGVMIPALLLSAAVHGIGLTQAIPPYWLVALVQIVIGSAAGSRFAGIRWREVRLILLSALGWALFLVGAAVAAAALFSPLLDRSVGTLTLAFSPGGMAEMTLIAFAIGTEVAFVVTCQVCRIMFIYLAAPLIFKLTGAGTTPPPGGSTT